MRARRLLRSIEFVLFSLQRHALKKSKFWLLGTALLFVGALVATSRLQMLLSIDDLIDPDFRTYGELQNLNQSFGDKNALSLIVASRDPEGVPSKSAICDLKGWIQRQVDSRHDIEVVLSSFGVRKADATGGGLTFRTFLAVDCARLSDPETEKIREGLKSIAKSPWGRTLTSRNANDVVVTFYLADVTGSKRFGTFDTQVVAEMRASLAKEFEPNHPEVRTEWFGIAAYQRSIREGFDQTTYLNLATAFVTLALFWFIFGTLRSGALFLGTILVSSVIIYGGLALTGCPIDVLTNSLTLMLLIASLEDFVFVLHQNTLGGTSWRRAFRQLLVPAFFTSFTTFVGFFSLYASDLGVIRRFGVWAALAAMTEWAIVFLVLPAALARFPRLRAWCTPSRAAARLGWFDTLGKWKLPRTVAVVLLAAYLVGGLGVRSLHVADAPPKVFPEGHEVREGLKSLEASRGWHTEISLVFADIENREFNERVISEFSASPMVGAIESPYAIEDYLVEGASELKGGIIRRYWRDTIVGRRLVHGSGLGRAMLYLKDTEIGEIDKLSRRAKALCPRGECHLAGSLVSYAEFGNRVLSTLMESLSVSLAIVSGILAFLIHARGIPNLVPLLLSAMWGPLAMMTIFYLFKIPVFYITSMFASILVGLAGDNTIQYVFGARKGRLAEGLESRQTASVVVSLSMMALSCVLFFSYFEPLRFLGGLLILGFAMALVGDLWLLKGLMSSKPLVDVEVPVEPQAIRGGQLV